MLGYTKDASRLRGDEAHGESTSRCHHPLNHIQFAKDVLKRGWTETIPTPPTAMGIQQRATRTLDGNNARSHRNPIHISRVGEDAMVMTCAGRDDVNF